MQHFSKLGTSVDYVYSSEQQAALDEWRPRLEELRSYRDSLPLNSREWIEADKTLGKADKQAVYAYAAQKPGYYLVEVKR